MTIEEAKTKICPFQEYDYQNKQFCLADMCMAWKSTTNGKKEIDRYKMPYDITPYEQSKKIDELTKKGYIETSIKGDMRATYIKYEEAHEGYCKRLVEK